MAASRIRPGIILEALREAVTVVEPGEVLAVRVAHRLTAEEHDEMKRRAEEIRAGLGVSVLWIEGDEFARLKAGDA